jgi:hypothetical protein
MIGLIVSQRNMGLMLAATDGVLPGLTWFYFALCQFPIYLSPQLLKPIARKLCFALKGRQKPSFKSRSNFAGCPLLRRFSDAGLTSLSTRSCGRRPKSAKARNRGKWGSCGAAGAMGIRPRRRA